MIAVMTKTEYAEKVFNATWQGKLLEGETIVSSIWELETGQDDALTIFAPDSVHPPMINSPLVSVWLAGGTMWKVYKISNKIETSLGRKLDGAFMLEITESGV